MDDATLPSPDHRSAAVKNPYLLLLPGFCLSLFMLAVSLTRTLSHDVGLFIFLSTRMLDGARFYRDIIEPNPPLIIYIHMLPTVAARLLGVSTITAFHVFAFVLFNYAIISTLPFIKATRYLSGNVAASSMILFCLYLSAFVLPFMWDSYEQREHILCLLALPYLFSCISYLDGDHHVGRTALINAGILAGIGFAIKPQFVLIGLGCEAFVALKKQADHTLKRPAALAMLASTSAFLLIQVFFSKDYFLRVVPLLLDLYPAYYDTFPHVLRMILEGSLLIPAAIICIALIGKETFQQRTTLLFLFVLVVQAAIIALLQPTTWRYHSFPVLFLSFLFFSVVASTHRLGRLLVPVLVSLYAGQDVPHMLSTYVTRKDPYIEEFVGPVRQNAVNQSILVLSSSIEPAFPLVNYANVRYDYPALFLFHLPALYASARGTNSYPVYRVPAEMGETEKWFLDMLVDTMERHPPQIMIVNTEDHKQGFPGMRFDFLRYYLGDDRFRQRWAHYRFLRRYSYYDIYRLDESL